MRKTGSRPATVLPTSSLYALFKTTFPQLTSIVQKETLEV